MTATSEIFLDQINAEALREEWENTRSRALKREIIKEGYTHQVSFYGILTNIETEESQYSRIEVLSNESYNSDDMILLHVWFNQLKPLDIYTIWIYDQPTRRVKLRGRFN